MAIAEVRKEIRRALEAPFNTLCAAQDPQIPIQWVGIPVDRNQSPPPRYFSVEINWGSVSVLEIGPTPRFRGNGGLTIITRTPSNGGSDQNDTLSALISTAYPYGSTVNFNGITVYIDKITPGAYGIDGAWLTGMTTVDWEVFRRP